MTSPSPLISSMSLLPALSVVLGMPLCTSNCGNDVFSIPKLLEAGSNDYGDDDRLNDVNHRGHDHNSGNHSQYIKRHHKQNRTQPSESRGKGHQSQQEKFAKRAKDNVSRIYARRMMIKAQLERSHPWRNYSGDAAADGTSAGVSSAPAVRKAASGSETHSAQTTRTDKNFVKNENGWQDDLKRTLLSETLLSLLKLKERYEKCTEFYDGSKQSHKKGDNVDFLSPFGISFDNFKHYHHNHRNFHFNFNPVALCESSKQRTLNEYNALSSSSSSSMDELKPAEWNKDIDLAQRRLEFGEKISPLSNTTRLERWTMAVKRMVTLGALAAPIGVMVPGIWVLGGLAGDYDYDENADDDVDASGGNVDDGKRGTDGIKSSSQKLSLLQRYHRSLTDRTWSYALWAIEQAGPTYIKLVQWASTRNDLFSPEFVGHFSKLQDETRGHSWKDTEVALEKAFGKDWRGILSFDRVIEDEYEGGVDGGMRGVGSSANRERQERLGRRETLGKGGGNVGKGKKSGSRKEDLPTIPIGSGCVAQVYKARLRISHGLHPAGTSVAVKVQHPHILEKVCLDFYIMNKFASILEYIPYLNLDYLSMKDSVDQFRDIMLPQLDLRVEAHNLKRFRRDFEGETQIAFPEPLVDLTSREVLVEKFVEGEPMLNFVKKEDEFHRRKDREELASIGLKTVMKMIFLNDFIHADLHPGNMIVDRNKSVRGQPLRIHMIDCGLTVELGERDHVNMVKILGSLIKRDGYAAGKLMVDTAKKCQATELDVELFCRGIDKIVEDDEDNNFLESVGDYITDICYLACKHKVKLEAAFINAALACEIMEGLAASLYPEMRVQQVALPLVLKAEMMHGLKGLPAAKLWMGS